MTAPILISEDLRVEVVQHLQSVIEQKKAHLQRMEHANSINPENAFDILPTLVELTAAKVSLRAIQAPTEVWEIINPGEGTYYSPHGPQDYEDVEAQLIFKVVEIE